MFFIKANSKLFFERKNVFQKQFRIIIAVFSSQRTSLKSFSPIGCLENLKKKSFEILSPVGWLDNLQKPLKSCASIGGLDDLQKRCLASSAAKIA